jgi:ABC-type bacteriocin/lantibiotic exporter with double-glycine peptidase domain
MRHLGAMLALAVAACVSYNGGARPFDPDRLRTEPAWIFAPSTPVMHQAGSRDCGAAALAMVASHWHVSLSLDQTVAALPPAGATGVRLGALRDTARARGLTAFAIAGDRATLVHELRAGRPVIVGLQLRSDSKHAQHHYEVIVAAGHDGDGPFVTIDPVEGWRVRSWSELDAAWSPVGRPTLVVVGVADMLSHR